MRESTLERNLRRWLWKTYRLEFLKLQDQGKPSFPDRSIICSGGRIICVETKAGKNGPSPGQNRRAAELRALGVPVLISADPEVIKSWISQQLLNYGYPIPTSNPHSDS